MTESSFGGDSEPIEGATVEGEGTPDSATADRKAAFDDPTSSSAGNVTGENAVIADPPGDSTAADDLGDSTQETSHDADVEAGYEEDSDS